MTGLYDTSLREFGNCKDSDLSTSSNSISKRFKLDSKYVGLSDNVWKEFIALDREFHPVNLSSGAPDYTPVQEIVDRWNTLCGLTNNSEMHQYTLPSGSPRLVNVLAKLYGKLLNRVIDPKTEIIITLGASNALFCAIMSNVGHGEEVIIIEPFFDCYESLVKLAGGKPVFIPLRRTNFGTNSSSGWTLDMEELASLFNSKTKGLILNTPNNPLGKVFTKSELMEIAILCKKHEVLIISDEVYEWFVYDGSHERISSILWEQTVTLGSVGKTFGLTGWRIGWAYGPSYLIQNLQVACSNGIYSVETPGQEIIAATLEAELEKLGTPESIFTKMRIDLENRRNQMVQIAANCGMSPIVPEAGVFVIANWRHLASNKDLNGEGDSQPDFRFVKWLVKNWKLLGIPSSVFYSASHKYLAEDFIRLCFYRQTKTLIKANEILTQVQARKLQ